MALIKSVSYYIAPTTGNTVTVPTFDGQRLVVFIEPAGTLATLTITLPSAVDGQSVAIGTSQILTAITINGGTIISGITTLALGGFAEYVYSGTASKWFRIG